MAWAERSKNEAAFLQRSDELEKSGADMKLCLHVILFNKYWNNLRSDYGDTTDLRRVLKYMNQVVKTDDYSYQNPFGEDDTETILNKFSEFPKESQKKIYSLCKRESQSKQKVYAVDILNAIYPKAKNQESTENSERSPVETIQGKKAINNSGAKRAHLEDSTSVASSSKKQKVDGESKADSQETANVWILSSKRKVKLDRFRSRLLISIREFYIKDGEEKPGRKGIALTPDQWSKLYGCMGEIDEKLQKGELTDWDLSARRKARVTKFKDLIMVDLREVYTKDGKELPGKKGISLTIEQWNKLVKASKGVDEAVKRESTK
mmetsp:Transcript_19742/g.38216  ORF Transcript_19742/g.38216 Transcript_19742/m.38216 type:complete len:321 (+) Transcript_19742:35-997(+)